MLKSKDLGLHKMPWQDLRRKENKKMLLGLMNSYEIDALFFLCR